MPYTFERSQIILQLKTQVHLKQSIISIKNQDARSPIFWTFNSIIFLRFRLAFSFNITCILNFWRQKEQLSQKGIRRILPLIFIESFIKILFIQLVIYKFQQQSHLSINVKIDLEINQLQEDFIKIQKYKKLQQNIMNRVILSVLSEKNNLRKQDIEKLSEICQARPLQQIWKCQKFAIFPIQINFYLSNPPFNKISLSIPNDLKTKIEIWGSKSGKQFYKIQQINNDKDDFDISMDGGIVSKFFKQSYYFNYLRFKFFQPQVSKNSRNICKQIGVRAIQVSNIIYFNAKYLCSLKKRLELHPCLFRLLQLLEYKTFVLTKELSRSQESINQYKTSRKQKYIKRMGQIQDLIYKSKINPIHPNQDTMEKLNNEFEQLLQEPILQEQNLDFSDPIHLKKQIKRLQKQLAQFCVDRLNNMQANVTDYFRKYWNVQIRDIYLRYLSSPSQQDKTKALVQFWSQIKMLQKIQPNIQQATLMFLNYYLQFIQGVFKLDSIKVLSLFLKIQNIGFKHHFVYQRILFNLLNCIFKSTAEQQLYKCAYKTIFIMYKKMPNQKFVDEFMNKQTHSRLQQKLKKLQILQKIVINDENFQIQKKQQLIEFLLDILLVKQLKVQQKQRAYNIAAWLAYNFGKQNVMGDFQKLNSMILMNMEKIIDKKLSQLKLNQNQNSKINPDQRSMCDFCGEQNFKFKDQNIYDIHCFKQCKMLYSCQHCACIIEIPQLFKHYLEECSLKNKFKNCDNCSDVILIQKQNEHDKKCTKNFNTKCPLCQQKLQSKLRIKEHILKDGCPNNPRNYQNQ